MDSLTNVPKLGFGMMRLPMQDEVVDLEQVCRMVDAYMEAGFHYFDTAYNYHGGKSESIVKKTVVERYPRDSFFLTSKLPGWEIHNKEDRDRVFQEQLERTGAKYFDNYLLHSIQDENYENYEKHDCFSWGVSQKKAGRIRHFGFSFHGTPALLEKILDRHPQVEFVQIQLNYADWEDPVVASRELYEILRRRNLPIIVMEPVKGGTLTKLPPKAEELLRAAAPERSLASWALRYAAGMVGVVTVLSGMSDEEQMADNLKTFKNFEPLGEEEQAVVAGVVEAMRDQPMVACTDCRYCVEGCPQGIIIPEVIKGINSARLYPKDSSPKSFYERVVKTSGKASDCIACGQCEDICPQHLPIIDLMREATERFEKAEAAK